MSYIKGVERPMKPNWNNLVIYVRHYDKKSSRMEHFRWTTTLDYNYCCFYFLLLLFSKREMQVGQTLSTVKTEASSRVRKMLTVATKMPILCDAILFLVSSN